MNFRSSNEFICPHCQSILDTAAAAHPDNKPMDGHFTICCECAGVCMYVIKEGVVSLRRPEEKDLDFAHQSGLWDQIEQMVDFVKSRPK